MANEVVLVYPPYKDLVTEAEGILEPLSLTYLAGYLKKNGTLVSIIDITATNISLSQFIQIIKEKNPKIVGIYANVPLILKAVQVAKVVRRINKEIKIIIGGHQPTALPIETLESFSCFDVAVIGEGEETMLELTREIMRGSSDFGKIKGIAFRQNNEIVVNPSREPIKNLDAIPFPAREMVDFSNYRPPLKAYFSKPLATMITSRGCPYRCIFCAYAKGVCRLRSPENVIEEIRELINNYRVKSILFYDDTFTFDKERAMKICDLIISNGFNIDWICWSRIDAVSEDLLKKMKKAGCQLISYGVESGSQRMLNIMKKGTTLPRIKETIKLTKEIGIKTSASYVLGIPGETKQSISETIKFAKSLNTTFAHFNMITPWPGTELYNQLIEENKISKEEWKKYAKKLGMHIPTIDLGEMTTDDLKKVVPCAYRNFYLNPGKIWELFKSEISFATLKSYLLAFKTLLKL